VGLIAVALENHEGDESKDEAYPDGKEESSSNNSSSTTRSTNPCLCAYHAPHWSHINEPRTPVFHFSQSPSLLLYEMIQHLSPSNSDGTIERQRNINSKKKLSPISTSSSSTYISTLSNYTANEDQCRLLKLIRSHSHWLRANNPEDAEMLSSSSLHTRPCFLRRLLMWRRMIM
jgi:hypothetical protein